MVVCSFKFGAKTSVLLIHRRGIWVKTENDKQNPKNTALGNPLYPLTIKSCFTRMSWPVQANPKASERAEASLSFQNFAWNGPDREIIGQISASETWRTQPGNGALLWAWPGQATHSQRLARKQDVGCLGVTVPSPAHQAAVPIQGRSRNLSSGVCSRRGTAVLKAVWMNSVLGQGENF